ncbi:MAG: GGDEF domain-containing protein [Acetatifactor sp.]|nr:GGDEF domain-containing protein [Acetatifactor sp.]MDE7353200.1 GGDEF domain-containing protein [Acetatifactor sp.]
MKEKSNKRRLKEEEWDQLTGLLKKSIAEERIASRMIETRGGTLFLCDVDHMKRINEQYGHQMGDECLKRAAQILSYMIGSDDILSRCGGDEFVIFMPGCQDAEQAQEHCRRIQERFHTGRGKEKNRVPFSLTVVWEQRKSGNTYQMLFEHVWDKLEQQKRLLDITKAESDKRKDHYVADVRRVKEELTEQIRKQEAYCRDYETFKSIYRFLERGIARSGQKACVILLTVVDGHGKSPLPYEKDMLMEQLGRDIGMTLRIGDVYTRYSSSQYLLLVIDTTEGQVDRIVDRIRRRFVEGRQGEDVLIHHCYELQSVRNEQVMI